MLATLVYQRLLHVVCFSGHVRWLHGGSSSGYSYQGLKHMNRNPRIKIAKKNQPKGFNTKHVFSKQPEKMPVQSTPKEVEFFDLFFFSYPVLLNTHIEGCVKIVSWIISLRAYFLAAWEGILQKNQVLQQVWLQVCWPRSQPMRVASGAQRRDFQTVDGWISGSGERWCSGRDYITL